MKELSCKGCSTIDVVLEINLIALYKYDLHGWQESTAPPPSQLRECISVSLQYVIGISHFCIGRFAHIFSYIYYTGVLQTINYDWLGGWFLRLGHFYNIKCNLNIMFGMEHLLKPQLLCRYVLHSKLCLGLDKNVKVYGLV